MTRCKTSIQQHRVLRLESGGVSAKAPRPNSDSLRLELLFLGGHG